MRVFSALSTFRLGKALSLVVKHICGTLIFDLLEAGFCYIS